MSVKKGKEKKNDSPTELEIRKIWMNLIQNFTLTALCRRREKQETYVSALFFFPLKLVAWGSDESVKMRAPRFVLR